ncbi:Protein O-mannosyltransferase 2 [Irineochytrium annulatum]|nr:Protein O-mannosyltransferase 2 [Irineochytrium annulatum]
MTDVRKRTKKTVRDDDDGADVVALAEKVRAEADRAKAKVDEAKEKAERAEGAATKDPRDDKDENAEEDEDDNEKESKIRRKLAEEEEEEPSIKNTIVRLIVPLILTGASFWTRLYKINWADYVVWDEAHFGKFASHYIEREFYFDVHPPLGKMLLGLSGVISGYNGSFEFESGVKYPDYVNYTGMRVFSAVFGALMVPLAYFTARQLHFSPIACVLMACMVLMALTGISLGCVASVKWVGLFAIALVGLHTIEDLWDMLGDLKMPLRIYATHWLARIVLLIILPISVYVLSFALHFAILTNSGPGDAQMSSLFQAGLNGNTFHENPLELAYGSRVSLKNNGHGGGLLHSHVQTYPTGSEQQQVTCYHHKDANNEWLITKPWGANRSTTDDVEFVKNGDIIRLGACEVHDQTRRNLHSHANHKAPVSTTEQEVSCYGNETIGDQNDHWQIQIVDDLYDSKPVRIKSLTTRFLLRHVVIGCLLRSGSVTLPQWGFKQAEVACQPAAVEDSKNNMWNIEQHWHPRLPAGGIGAFKSSFIKDFADLNVAMWTSNNALTPDPDKEPDGLTSQPYEWPLLLVGLRMCGWGDTDVKFFLIGNPVVWWGSTGSLVVFFIVGLVYTVRAQRHCKDWRDPDAWNNFWFAGKVGFLGWFLHYIPFWIMGRVTYLHHYFPALYFAIIMYVFMLDHVFKQLPSILHRLLLAAVGFGVFANFMYFSDFAFGMGGPAVEYSGRRWLRSWKIHD